MHHWHQRIDECWEIGEKLAFFVQTRAVAEISYLAKSVAEKCYPGKKL